MDSLTSLLNRVDIFLVVMARVSGVLLVAPVFSSRNLPAQVKAGLIVLISIIVFMAKHPQMATVPTSIIPFVLLLISELVIGLIIGFASYLIFSVIYIAGQEIDMHIGFAMVNVVDPLSGISVPLVGTFKYMIAILVYLTTNSYNYLFAALFHSYDVIPLLGFQPNKAISTYLIGMFGNVLALSVKLAVPIVGALLVAEVALGIIARTVPQMNVFLVGIPAKIVIGIILLVLILPFYMFFLDMLFETNYSDLLKLIKLAH
ncbi:flagellar biosynthetic protein FliR [Thermincola potens]|uniref:Flagellar biosynthetic protein FliR n=1 Tax=Thermincola potens (strain JR) TaxID=635013 RepID=D5XFF6_THEPJ|nr:flagellar biosynthetic protein FliR [Thermincola potens]ADG82377.1 flagellar biosynthetic protein FliR [Thermincola potens JR]